MNLHRSKAQREQDLLDELNGELLRRHEELAAADAAALRKLDPTRAYVDGDDERQDQATRWDEHDGEVLAWS